MPLEDVCFTIKNRVHQSSNARLGEALDFPRFGDRQHFLGSQTPPRVLWGSKFRISAGHKARESIGPTKHESSGSLSSSPHAIAHSSVAKAAALECRKGSANGNAGFLACWPVPATGNDRSALTSFNPEGLTSPSPVGDSGIYLLRTGGLRTPPLSVPGVVLGGLVPRTESTALGRLVPHTESTALGRLVPRALRRKLCVGWARAPH